MQILEKSVGFPATRSDVTYVAPAHVIEHVLVDTYAAPARLAPAPVTNYIAQAHVAPSYPHFSTGLVNLQFSPTCVAVSTPKVTSSSQAHQEHLVVGHTTQNGVEFHFVQERVIVQEIPDQKYKLLSKSSNQGNLYRHGSRNSCVKGEEIEITTLCNH